MALGGRMSGSIASHKRKEVGKVESWQSVSGGASAGDRAWHQKPSLNREEL